MVRAMIHGASSAYARALIGLCIAIIAGVRTGLAAHQKTDHRGNPLNPGLHASEILKFEKSLASANLPEGAYRPFVRIAFGNSSAEVLAFEENQTFIYLMGVLPSARGAQDSPASCRAPALFRRLIFLKPSILIVDDEISTPVRGLRWNGVSTLRRYPLLQTIESASSREMASFFARRCFHRM